MRKLNQLSLMGSLRIMFTFSMLLLIGGYAPVNGQCTPGTGEVSGHIFNDADNNGQINNGERPVANVLVTAYNALGSSVGSAISDAQGAYVIDGLVDGEGVRLEFRYGQNYTESGLGVDNLSAVQFVKVPSCNQSLGLRQKDQGCLQTPDLIVSCFVQGEISENPDVETLVGLTSEFGSSTQPYKIASQAETGSVWGMAYKNRGNEIFSSSFVKQYAGLKDGPVAIYRTIHNGTNYVTSKFIDFDELDVPYAPLVSTDLSDCAYGAQVGRFGLGALEISQDENFLYVVNISEHSVVRIPTLNPDKNNVVSYNVPDPGCGSNYEVFALKVHDGALFVGATCTGEDFNGTPEEKAAMSAGVVFQMNMETGDFVEVFRTEYLKGYWDDGDISGERTMHWLTDIDFTKEGNMILSLSDRVGHRYCVDPNSVDPANFTNRLDDQNPDILIAYKNDQNQWTLESNGSAGELIGSGVGNGQGPDGGEFFGQDEWPAKPNVHPEVALGSVLVLEGGSQVVATVFDPITNSYSAGLHKYDTRNGQRLSAVELYSHSINPQFGKASGFGDIVSTCTAAAINIGNYVWNDTNFNGVQDPGERPVEGVEIELFNDNCDLVGTTITNQNGYYVFNASNVDVDLDGSMDALLPNTKYYISISKNQFDSELESVQLNNETYLITRKVEGNYHNKASIISGACDSEVLVEIITPQGNTNDYSFDIGLTTSIEFDLALRTTIVGSPYVIHGRSVDFAIEVFNQGNVAAQNIEITNYVPSGLSFPIEDNEGWINTDGILTYTIADKLQPSQATTISLTLKAEGEGTDFINVAEISKAEDLQGGHPNDLDSEYDQIKNNDRGGEWGTSTDDEILDDGTSDEDDHDPAAVRVFDLALKYELGAQDGQNSPDVGSMAGDQVKFDVFVYNQGNVSASGFDITVYGMNDLVLSEVEENEGWDFEAGNYVFSVSETLRAGQRYEASIYFDIDEETNLSQIVQYAEISAATPQGNLNISDFDSTPDAINDDLGGEIFTATDNEIFDHGAIDEDDHDPAAVLIDYVDLALVKVADRFFVNAGEVVNYTITVSNQGTVPVYKVAIVDYVPEGLELLDLSWTEAGDKLKKTIEIPNGISEGQQVETQIRFLVKESARGAILNQAEIYAMYDEDGNDISDLDMDSTPDLIGDNDMGGDPLTDTDDNITAPPSVDEDDHDPALVVVAAIGVEMDSCLGNATNSMNGQFEVEISETSLSGENWYIDDAHGLYTTSSPAPPASPTVLPEGPMAGLMQEEDLGGGMSRYFVRARYVEGIDYSITITNGDPSSTQTLNETAETYEDLVISGLSSLCIGSTETYSIPSIPGATYTWSLSGGGDFVGSTNTNSVDVQWNNDFGGPYTLSVEVSEVGCYAPAALDVYLGTGGSTMSCYGNVNFSLNHNCEVEITPQKLSTVNLPPDAGFNVVLMIGNEVLPSNVLTDAHIGKQIMGKLMDGCGNNSCWSTIRVEDKINPTIDCPDTIEITCFDMNRDFRPPASDNCNGPVNVRETYFVENPLFCDDYVMRIDAGYIATDEHGNESEEKDVVINVLRPDMTTVTFPEDRSIGNGMELTCNSFETLEDGSPALHETGVPMLGGINLNPGTAVGLCNIGVSVETRRVGVIGNVTKYMRRFTVYEAWCTSGILLDSTQLIEVRDNQPPVIPYCGDDIEASANSANCMATVYIPPLVDVEDACGNGVNVQIRANNSMVVNNIATLPEGKHKVTYLVSDNLGNIDSCHIYVNVEDNTAPVVVCDTETTIGINSQGFGYAYASVFDDGSEDACGIDRMMVRRMDGGAPCGEVSFEYQEFVTFCCEDVSNDNLLVELTVWDFNNNSNTCMVRVEVQDKNPPIVTCLDDVRVDCDTDVSDLSVFGFPTFTDTCGATLEVLEPIYDLNPCGVGTIERRFEITDGSNVIPCSQMITITNDTKFVFDPAGFPQDYYTTECNREVLTPDDLPDGFNRPVINNGSCDMADASYTDLGPIAVDADSLTCYKIIRTWTILDWCQVDDPGYEPYVSDQLIVVENAVAPTILGGFDLVSDTTNMMCGFGEISLFNTAEDDCTLAQDLTYTYAIDYFKDGVIDLEVSNMGPTANVSLDSVPVGQHTILWTWNDGCSNQSSRLQDFEMIDNEGPVAVCRDVIIGLVGMDLNGDGDVDAEMACLPIDSINASSFHPCGDSIFFSFSADIEDDTLKLDCNDLGVNTFVFWVTDADGNTSTCTFEVEVQDNNDYEICREFDLALIKTLNETETNLPLVYGDDITFDITVCNQGGFPTDTIEIVDYIPDGLALNDSDWVAGTAGVSGKSATYLMTRSNGRLPSDGLPVSGDSCITVPITLTLLEGATPADLLNYAEICKSVDVVGNSDDDDSVADKDDTNDGSVFPGDPHDDSFDGFVDEDDYDVATVPIFDLALIKTTDVTGPFTLGQEVQFDITVFNQGNVGAREIEIIDYLPCGLSLSPNGNAGWVSTGNEVEFTYTPLLAPGDSVVIPIILVIEACNDTDAYVNFAEIVDALDEDSNPTEDVDSDPDDTNGNDTGGVVNTDTDNTSNNENGDEDDHDPEDIDVEYCDLCMDVGLMYTGQLEYNVSTVNDSCSAYVSIPVPTIINNDCNEPLQITHDYADADNPNGPDASGVFPVGDSTVITFTLSTICVDTSFQVVVRVSDGDGPICNDGFIHPELTLTTGMPVVTLDTAFILSQFTDACGEVDVNSIVLSDSSFDCGDVGTASFTVTVSDNSVPPNSTTCMGSVNIVNDIAPVCNTQDVTVYLDENGEATVDGASLNNGSQGSCGSDIVLVTVNPFMFTCNDIGDTTVSIFIRDAFGNDTTCMATVTVVDTLAPVCALQDVTVSLTGNDVTVDVLADLDNGTSDNCGTIEFSPSTFTFDCTSLHGLASLDTTIFVTVSDGNNPPNSTVCEATVTIIDNTTINCETVDTFVYLGSNGMVNITPDLIDDGSTVGCGLTPILSIDQDFFACNDIGLFNQVVLTVSDGVNSATCTANVEVRDTFPPEISIPDVTIECEDFGTADLGTPTIVDNCIMVFPVDTIFMFDFSNLNACNIGTYTRTIIAVDTSGNADTVVQTITVVNSDNVFGISNITFPAADTTFLCEDVPNGGTPYAGTPIIDETGVDCSLISIDSTVMNLNPNACPDTIRKTWTIIDSCQLDGTGAGIFTFVQDIEITDTIAPVITGPMFNGALVADGDTLMLPVDTSTCEVSYSLTASATDCSSFTVDNNVTFDGTLTVNDTINNGEVVNLTYTATDLCNNIAEYNITIIGVDTSEMRFECNKLEFDMPDTLLIEVPYRNWFVPFGSWLNCIGNSEIILTGTFGDLSDTINVMDCSNLGIQRITMYVYVNGVFVDSCRGLQQVDDPNGYCPSTLTSANITGSVSTPNGEPLMGAEVMLEGGGTSDMTDNNGDYAFEDMPTGGQYRVVPSYDKDHDKGVSTLDLILIQRHILGHQTFDSPYKYVAADVNNSGSITGFDVVTLRKMVLGQISVFPDNTSFRMMDARESFAEDEDALYGFNDDLMIPQFAHNIYADFIGIKVGDVNGSYSPFSVSGNIVETRSVKWLDLEQESAGKLNVTSSSDELLKGMQMSLTVSNSDIEISSDLLTINEYDYVIEGNTLKLSWMDVNGINIREGDVLFSISSREELKVSDVQLDASMNAEMYTDDELNVFLVNLRNQVYENQLIVEQNMPNPWTDRTEIAFIVGKKSNVALYITDVTGRMVYNTEKEFYPGVNRFKLDRNDLFSNGVYYYTISNGEQSITQKMIIVR
jgi:uncharacterized repeat protein (TIGR01451 family)